MNTVGTYFSYFHPNFIKFARENSSLLKQILCNIRRSQGRGRTRGLKCVLKGYLSVFYLYSTWRTRFWGFFPEFSSPGSGIRVRGSNFKSHSNIPKPISDCSVRRAESIGTNIFQTRPFYHKLRLKTVQKCQKYGVLDRKVNFSHLFLDITSQFFHTIICTFCSF